MNRVRAKPLVIALHAASFPWGGGADFLRYLANGILAASTDESARLCLCLPVSNRIESVVSLLRVFKRSIVSSMKSRRPRFASESPVYHESFLDLFGNAVAARVELVQYEDSADGLARCMQRIGADVILPVNGVLPPTLKVPWIGYLYDFQHRYLSQNFERRECFDREFDFVRRLRDSKLLLVNSLAVRNDACRFYPWVSEDHFVALPFLPSAVPEWLADPAFDVASKYKLPESFFLISNQFWAHKDHLTAFRALAQIAGSTDANIVCTGTENDYRRPSYMNDLYGYIKSNGLNSRIRLLGHIPKSDQIAIMKSSVAVVQPTRFEGGPGGGSIYDAIAVGVPSIVSDIPVNLEVVGENVEFFRTGDDSDLADRMRRILNRPPVRPSREQLLANSELNRVKLGRVILDAVARVLGEGKVRRAWSDLSPDTV